MQANDQPKMKKGAIAKIKALTDKGTWIEVLRSSAKGKILLLLWVFSRRRRKFNSHMSVLLKVKGHIVLRGDLQLNFDNKDIYSPVAAWPTV